MSDEETIQLNYIFYLQTKPELDQHFYFMAELFAKVNISLLPIEASDLKVIDRNKKHHIIAVRNDLTSAYAFNDLRKTYLDVAMASGKVTVYDLSSFSSIENATKLESKNVYRYYHLPQNLKQIAMTIVVEFFKERNVREEWPGGKRAKLPSMQKDT